MLWLGHPEHDTTWEPSSALSPLVLDYEASVQKEASSETNAKYGLTSTMVIMKDSPQVPDLKRARKEDYSQMNITG